MTPGDYIDAILACLGGGPTPSEKAAWLQQPAHACGAPTDTRLAQVLNGKGVFVLAEAAAYVDGMVAS